MDRKYEVKISPDAVCIGNHVFCPNIKKIFSGVFNKIHPIYLTEYMVLWQ